MKESITIDTENQIGILGEVKRHFQSVFKTNKSKVELLVSSTLVFASGNCAKYLFNFCENPLTIVQTR